MRNHWLNSMDSDGFSPDIFSLEPFLLHNLGSQMFSQISSFVENSTYESRYLYVPGSVALREAINCISKLAGALIVWCCSVPSTNLTQDIAGSSPNSTHGSCKTSMQIKQITSLRSNLAGFRFRFRTKKEPIAPMPLGKISSFTIKLLQREFGRLQSYPVLSLAAALVPPFQNLSSKILSVPMENPDVQVREDTHQLPCEIEQQGCGQLPELNWTRHTTEPRTGIEFPMILDNILKGENNSSSNSEVLVGTGSRTMTIVKIKSLKVYAFGFYIHPRTACAKLGLKYASISPDELNKHQDFYDDLLREDINMTVRLVVNCKGMKVNTVKDAFEKSLRARLVKTNPNTDYQCLRTFGSYFTQDIPLPLGTIIDFQRTVDGHLITRIGGNQIGSVHSKDLCRAFFDMYIGDHPVSEQAKEEIGKNVADIVRRC